MGCCFSGGQEENRSLLNAKNYGTTSHTHHQYDNNHQDGTPRSARIHKRKETQGAAEAHTFALNMKTVKISSVDKCFQDHALLFNGQVDRRNAVQNLVQELKHMFPEDNPQKSLHDCFYHIRKALKGKEDLIEVKRRYQHCMEIVYKEDRDLPFDVIAAFLTFNKANKFIKEILDKSHGIINSVYLVLKKERELRRDVLSASLGAEGPDCMKTFMDNMSQLKQVESLCNEIRSEALSTFAELSSSVSMLIVDSS